MSHRVLVCGGRDFKDRRLAWLVLDALHNSHGIEHIIHGDAKGADTIANAWARTRMVDQTAFPVYPEDWKRLGKKAGPLRNERMLREGQPHLCVAFEGGNGTADMVRRCVAASVQTLLVRSQPDGSYTLTPAGLRTASAKPSPQPSPDA